MDAETRRYLREELIIYSASAQTARFGPEVKLVHENTTDVIGEHHAIYNETTKELFVYHYDRQKGVGKKYNMSCGLIRCVEPMKIRENFGAIPGYDVYKSQLRHSNSLLGSLRIGSEVLEVYLGVQSFLLSHLR